MNGGATISPGPLPPWLYNKMSPVEAASLGAKSGAEIAQSWISARAQRSNEAYQQVLMDRLNKETDMQKRMAPMLERKMTADAAIAEQSLQNQIDTAHGTAELLKVYGGYQKKTDPQLLSDMGDVVAKYHGLGGSPILHQLITNIGQSTTAENALKRAQTVSDWHRYAVDAKSSDAAMQADSREWIASQHDKSREAAASIISNGRITATNIKTKEDYDKFMARLDQASATGTMTYAQKKALDGNIAAINDAVKRGEISYQDAAGKIAIAARPYSVQINAGRVKTPNPFGPEFQPDTGLEGVPVPIRTTDQYNALPGGTHYVDRNGVTGYKPIPKAASAPAMIEVPGAGDFGAPVQEVPQEEEQPEIPEVE